VANQDHGMPQSSKSTQGCTYRSANHQRDYYADSGSWTHTLVEYESTSYQSNQTNFQIILTRVNMN